MAAGPAGAQPPIAGIWRRFAAFAIDCLILGLPTLLIGLALFGPAVRLGEAGRFVGFVVALLYFGLLNGRLGGGQTLGKRWLGIRVADRSGSTLSPSRSVVRYLVIAVLYFLNGISFDMDAASAGPLDYMIGILLVFVVFGGLGSIVYLYLFNRRTRQSLHDLAVGSFVVRGPPAAIETDIATPRLHLVVVACWLALALILPGMGIWASRQSSFEEAMKPLGDLQSAVRTELGARKVKVTMGSSSFATIREGATTTTFLEVDAEVGASPEEVDTLLLSIAATALDLYPDLLGKQVLIVHVQRGFDLGLARWSVGRQEALDAASWREKVSRARARPDRI